MTEPAPFLDLGATDRRVEVAILVCPGYAPIDIIGLQTIFGILPAATVHLVGKSREVVIGEPNFPTVPTTTFDECPRDLDVLFTGAVMPPAFDDDETLEFLADRGSRAEWVGGTCAGPLLLGAAGLMRGYRATTNFQQRDLLRLFGAIPTEGDVVEDRNRITAGPATGSIDIALRLVRHFYGDDIARTMELQIEYAPRPLYGVGSPELAGPELTRRALEQTAPMNERFVPVLERAARRIGTLPTAG